MSEPYSCWDGWELTGKVRTTILRGNVLVDDGNFVGSKTTGRFVERKLDPRVTQTPLDTEFTRTSLSGAGVGAAS
jgi:hypothetical protein